MRTENILVIGGNGKTGRRVAENLSQLGHNVSVVGRKTNPAFDWENTDTYDAALKDMDRAYVVYYPDLAVPGSRDAISTLTEKALQAGLEKVVLLSGKGETEAEACEDIVANSGLNYTLVRASWFNPELATMSSQASASVSPLPESNTTFSKPACKAFSVSVLIASLEPGTAKSG